MLDGIPIGALTNGIGVVAVVAVLGWLVATGRLIPRSTHQTQVAMLTQRIEDERHEAGEWRTEGRIKDQQILEKDEQLREKDKQLQHMSEVGRNVLAIVNALQAQRSGGSLEEDQT